VPPRPSRTFTNIHWVRLLQNAVDDAGTAPNSNDDLLAAVEGIFDSFPDELSQGPIEGFTGNGHSWADIAESYAWPPQDPLMHPDVQIVP
jgi:hypothetical protein